MKRWAIASCSGDTVGGYVLSRASFNGLAPGLCRCHAGCVRADVTSILFDRVIPMVLQQMTGAWARVRVSGIVGHHLSGRRRDSLKCK